MKKRFIYFLDSDGAYIKNEGMEEEEIFQAGVEIFIEFLKNQGIEKNVDLLKDIIEDVEDAIYEQEEREAIEDEDEYEGDVSFDYDFDEEQENDIDISFDFEGISSPKKIGEEELKEIMELLAKNDELFIESFEKMGMPKEEIEKILAEEKRTLRYQILNGTIGFKVDL